MLHILKMAIPIQNTTRCDVCSVCEIHVLCMWKVSAQWKFMGKSQLCTVTLWMDLKHVVTSWKEEVMFTTNKGIFNSQNFNSETRKKSDGSVLMFLILVCCAAVSYTHLDVYKRQLQWYSVCYFGSYFLCVMCSINIFYSDILLPKRSEYNCLISSSVIDISTIQNKY